MGICPAYEGDGNSRTPQSEGLALLRVGQALGDSQAFHSDCCRISDAVGFAYTQCQRGSGRVKLAVLVELTQKAFPEDSGERVVHRLQQLESPLRKH